MKSCLTNTLKKFSPLPDFLKNIIKALWFKKQDHRKAESSLGNANTQSCNTLKEEKLQLCVFSHLIYSLWVHVHSFSSNCCADNCHVTIASLSLLNPRSYSIQLLSGLSQTHFFHICSKFTISLSTIWTFISVFVVCKYPILFALYTNVPIFPFSC